MDKSDKVTEVMKLLNTIAENPQTLLFDPATTEDIDAVEQKLGKKLPESYKAFLLQSNGGWFYQTQQMYGTFISGDSLQDSILRIKDTEVEMPDNLIPFSQSNVYVCFDTNNKESGSEYSVVEWYLGSDKTYPVADNFVQWLKDFILDN
jgi:hypothetical protein